MSNGSAIRRHTPVVHVEESPMDGPVALEHGLFFRRRLEFVAPYFGPTDAKLVGHIHRLGGQHYRIDRAGRRRHECAERIAERPLKVAVGFNPRF